MNPCSERLRLMLELVPGAEPISGRLTNESGAQWAFTGWVELALVLEEALSAPRHPLGGAEPPSK